jgi:hypothetical protein
MGGIALTALPFGTAMAQDTCNALVSIGVSPGGATAVGNTRTITLSLGAGGIVGGTELTYNQVRYDLDCNSNFPLTLPCTDQGNIFSYQGDATISSTCGACAAGDLNAGATCAPVGPGGGCDAVVIGDNLGTCQAVTWTSNVPGGGNATNEIVFTPSTPLVIAANTFPYCDLIFSVLLNNLQPLVGPNVDGTPQDIEVVAGVTGTDASCDNTLNADNSASSSIPQVPPPTCGDGNLDPGETCDPPGSVPALPPSNINVCRADCTYCGDGLLQAPETCDTGGVPNRACNPNCTGRIARDPASIVFNVGRTDIDRLHVNGLIMPPTTIDPSVNVVGVRLSNGLGVIHEAELGVGAMTAVGRKHKFRNRAAKIDGGLSDFQFFPHRDGYRFKLSTFGDLSAATTAEMTIEVYFGGQQFVHSATWIKTKRGWRENGKVVESAP